MKTLVTTLLLGLTAAAPALAAHLDVATPQAIVAAVTNAQPGDIITIAPGRYELPGLRMRTNGTTKRKIELRAVTPGTVELISTATEFIKISGSDWVVDNLDIAGICPADDDCEHAFHIVAGADRAFIHHNRIRDYNAHIKGNGENGRFPQDVKIASNMLFNTRPRKTDNPIAPVDVVGGKGWTVQDNLIADYGKALAHPPTVKDDWSYGIFLKGDSSFGLIAGNIVGCDLAAPATPAVRGISLGGSITTPNTGLCDFGDDCTIEHRDGTIRDNLVLNCAGEPGIYLYKAARSRVLRNTLVATTGILAREAETSASIIDNKLDGKVWAENGARIIDATNRLLSADEARTNYLVPLLGPAKPPATTTIGSAVAAYRTYRETLAKR